jgi:hypothetical protein
MTEADYQLTVTTIGTVLVAITGTITAVFGYRNHQQGQTNAVKIDRVQETGQTAVTKIEAVQATGQASSEKISAVQDTIDGTAHTLAEHLASSQAANEGVIRAIASSTITPKPAPEVP